MVGKETCTMACRKGFDPCSKPNKRITCAVPEPSSATFMRVSLFSPISLSLKDNLVRSIGLNEWTEDLIGCVWFPLQLELGARVTRYREVVLKQCTRTTWRAQLKQRSLGPSNEF